MENFYKINPIKHCLSDFIRLENLALSQTKKSDIISDIISDRTGIMSTRNDIKSCDVDFISIKIKVSYT